MTRVSSVVVDASAALRAFVDGNVEATHWFRRIDADEITGAWPDLVFIEAAHGLRRMIRVGAISADRGLRALGSILRAPLERQPLALLAEPAFVIAGDRGISAYDACYIVLAETLDAPLVTADRRLAAATANAVLI